jgi:hypothetical protein
MWTKVRHHHRSRIAAPKPTTTIWQIRIVDSTSEVLALFFCLDWNVWTANRTAQLRSIGATNVHELEIAISELWQSRLSLSRLGHVSLNASSPL